MKVIHIWDYQPSYISKDWIGSCSEDISVLKGRRRKKQQQKKQPEKVSYSLRQEKDGGGGEEIH